MIEMKAIIHEKRKIRRNQPLSLINTHQAIDAQMYQAIKQLKGPDSLPKVKLSEGRLPYLESSQVDSGSITAAAHWWGFNITVPEGPLQTIYKASDFVVAITELAGAGFGIGGVPPVAVCAAVLGAFIEVEKLAIEAIDDGNGVYFSWTWLQIPFMVVPPFIGAQPVVTPITS